MSNKEYNPRNDYPNVEELENRLDAIIKKNGGHIEHL